MYADTLELQSHYFNSLYIRYIHAHKHVSMAGLHKYFKPALPSKGISEAATKEANAAVEKALEEGRQPRTILSNQKILK